MQLQGAIKNILDQLTGVLAKLQPEEYRYPCIYLSGNSIGQHVRHVIELFHCLEKGYETGLVNYENRKRDQRIETDPVLAQDLLHEISEHIHPQDKHLILLATYDEHLAQNLQIETNYFREIAYNLEHTIHHMALIRVGINEMNCFPLPENFGVASSTIKFKQQCAQ